MKRPDLPHLVWQSTKAKGKAYGPYPYFLSGKKKIRIKSAPDTPEFMQEYWELRAGKTPKTGSKRSWAALIESYRKTPKFRKAAPGTRANYERHYREILAKNADKAVSKFRRKHVLAVRDAMQDQWSKANERISVLSQLCNHAIDLEWISSNPCVNIEKLKGGSHSPWPDSKLKAFANYCDTHGLVHERTLFELAIGTGQRLGDCLNMLWSDFDGEYIRVTQQKTGTQIWIACPRRLLAYLAALPKSGRHIIAKNLTQAMAKRTMQQRIMAVRREIGATDLVIHGWRYNAAQELSETGASIDDIMAVTGHLSADMARKYAGNAAQKSRSKRAQDRRK